MVVGTTFEAFETEPVSGSSRDCRVVVEKRLARLLDSFWLLESTTEHRLTLTDGISPAEVVVHHTPMGPEEGFHHHPQKAKLGTRQQRSTSLNGVQSLQSVLLADIEDRCSTALCEFIVGCRIVDLI
jgi:hypothetical protein